jgi:hypothetical protein
MASVVGAAVAGKVHGRRRTEVDLEPLLLENRLGMRPFAIATGLVDQRTDAEGTLDLPAQRRELGGLELARQIARIGVRPIERLAMRWGRPGIEVRTDRHPAGPDVWLERPEPCLLRDDRVAQQIARDHAQSFEQVLHAVDRRHVRDRGVSAIERRGPVELFLRIDHCAQRGRRRSGQLAILLQRGALIDRIDARLDRNQRRCPSIRAAMRPLV